VHGISHTKTIQFPDKSKQFTTRPLYFLQIPI
jgi:hypothetical protein